MTNKINFVRSVKNYINTREPVSQRLLATLGVTDSGPVETGRANYVFCRIGETEVAYVYNQRVPNTPGLKVWIGFSKDRPDLYQVLDVADTFSSPLSNPVGPHSDTHTWPEKDTVWIRGEQYLPGLVAPYSGQAVAVYSQPVWGASGWRIPSLEYINLQAYNPASGSVWALIEHNASGSVSVRTSQWVQTKEMLEPWMIPNPSGTTCAAVALYGQGTIIATKRKSDIVDLRSTSPRGGTSGGGGGAETLEELSDVQVADKQYGDILQYVSGKWKNFHLFDTTKNPTGWINNQSVDVSYNKASGTITLTGDLRYYINGVQYQLTSPWTSPSHPTANGSYFLYAVSGTTIQWSTSAWDFWNLMVAKVNKTNNYHFALREPHGLMPWQVHEEFHDTVSSYHESGGEPVAGTYTENTATNLATTPSFAAAVMHDEDVKSSITSWAQGTYTTMWVGVSGSSRFDETSSFPFRASGSYILVNNVLTGAETPATNNEYVNVYQVLVPVTSDIDSQKYRMLMLQPQRTYASLTAAQAEDPRSLSFGDITASVPEFVVFTRITYVLAAGDSNTGKCRIATGGISYVLGTRLSQISTTYITPTAENVPFTPNGSISATNVQAAVQEVRDESLQILPTNRTVLGTDTSHPTDAFSGYQVKAEDVDVATSFVIAGDTLDVGGSVFGSHAGGTLSSPTSTKNDMRLASLAGGGYDGSNWIGSRAAIRLVASENWTGSSQGAEIEFWETLTGTATMVLRTSLSSLITRSKRDILPMAAYNALQPVTGLAGSVPYQVTVDRSMTLIKLSFSCYVDGTNNGSNYWSFYLRKLDGTDLLSAALTTASNSGSTWLLKTTTSFAISSVGAADFGVRLVASRTGTPSPVYISCPILEVES